MTDVIGPIFLIFETRESRVRPNSIASSGVNLPSATRSVAMTVVRGWDHRFPVGLHRQRPHQGVPHPTRCGPVKYSSAPHAQPVDFSILVCR